MTNTVDFGLPLDKILEFGNLVRSSLKDKDDKIVALTTSSSDLTTQLTSALAELATTKADLATALANDAADAATITKAQQDATDAQAKFTQAEGDASSARDELAALKLAVASDTNNQKLLAAIASLEGEFGLKSPSTPVTPTPSTPAAA